MMRGLITLAVAVGLFEQGMLALRSSSDDHGGGSLRLPPLDPGHGLGCWECWHIQHGAEGASGDPLTTGGVLLGCLQSEVPKVSPLSPDATLPAVWREGK